MLINPAPPMLFGLSAVKSALGPLQAPKVYTAPKAQPVSGSTTVAVVGAVVVLMVGAAAIFVWSKGKDKKKQNAD